MDAAVPDPVRPPKRRRRGFRPSAFKRVLKAADEAGKHVVGARIDVDGVIELVFGNPSNVSSSGESNDWD